MLLSKKMWAHHYATPSSIYTYYGYMYFYFIPLPAYFSTYFTSALFLVVRLIQKGFPCLRCMIFSLLLVSSIFLTLSFTLFVLIFCLIRCSTFRLSPEEVDFFPVVFYYYYYHYFVIVIVMIWWCFLQLFLRLFIEKYMYALTQMHMESSQRENITKKVDYFNNAFIILYILYMILSFSLVIFHVKQQSSSSAVKIDMRCCRWSA